LNGVASSGGIDILSSDEYFSIDILSTLSHGQLLGVSFQN